MYVGDIRLHCRACKAIFDGEIVQNAPFKVVRASMEALRCVECGSDELSIVLDEESLRKHLGLPTET